MKAAVIRRYGAPEELKLEERPDPVVGRGDVLVTVIATSVNPYDLEMRSGQVKDEVPLTFPAILGVDLSGIVEHVGPGVETLAVGDRVFGQAWQTYASRCAVKAAHLAEIPNGIDAIEAAALPTVTTTGAQLAELATRGRRSGTVLVTGALGNVGRSAVWVAKEYGWTVVAGVSKARMEEARVSGADSAVPLEDENTMLPTVDAVADTILGPVAARLIAKVKEGGTFASVLGRPSNASDYPSVKVEDMRVKPAPLTLLHMADAVKAGTLVIPLGPRFPLEDASRAHLAAESGTPGKLVLIPN